MAKVGDKVSKILNFEMQSAFHFKNLLSIRVLCDTLFRNVLE